MPRIGGTGASRRSAMTTPSSAIPPRASRHLHVTVHGMDCAEEAALIRQALAADPGVEALDFDVVGGQVEVRYDPARTSPEAIVSAIEATGLRSEAAHDHPHDHARPHDHGAPAARPGATRPVERPGLPWLLVAAGALFMTGWAIDAWRADGWIEAIVGHAHGPGEDGLHHREPASMAAYGLALVVGLWPTWPRAAAALRYRRLDMHVLVCVSAIGAAAIGQWSEAAAVAFLFALAHWMEAWSLARARAAVAALIGSGRELMAGSARPGADVERWIERFAAVYTPVVVGAAVLVALVPPLLDGAWAVWFYRALVFLVLACPCALVISTPVTVVAALASAARRGVLVKGGGALERAAASRTPTREALAADGVLVAGMEEPADRVSAADLVLVDGTEQTLPWFLGHARRALRVIHQNVSMALLTKLAFLVSALFGVAPLWLAVLADTGATVAVTLNGLRLLRA
jgi:cation transport ATPase